MSKSIKFKNNNYLDSSSIVHNRELLKNILDKKEVYSTEEQKIGTWIDGKTAYQKTFVVSTPTEPNKDTVVLDIPSNIKSFIKTDAQLFASNINVITRIPYYFSSENYGMLWNDLNTRTIQMLVTNNLYCNQELIIRLVYTKTTD